MEVAGRAPGLDCGRLLGRLSLAAELGWASVNCFNRDGRAVPSSGRVGGACPGVCHGC